MKKLMTFDDVVKGCTAIKVKEFDVEKNKYVTRTDYLPLKQYLDEKILDINTATRKHVNAVDNTMVVTHVGKYTDTYVPYNVAVYNNDKIESDYLCTATVNGDCFDIVYRDTSMASYSKFLMSRLTDGRTIYEHICSQSEEIVSGFEKHGIDFLEYREKLFPYLATNTNETNALISQVYYPLEDGYCLFSILHPTALNNEYQQRMWQILHERKVAKEKHRDNIPPLPRCTKPKKVFTSNTANAISYNTDAMQIFINSSPPKQLHSKNIKKRNKKLYPDENMINNLEGVHNGMLIDADKGLRDIILAGMIENAHKIKHYCRNQCASETTKKDFLNMYGYDSIPNGYNIHHIIPLSVNGADDPKNMILLSEQDHHVVTAMHKEHYHWGY